MLKQDKIAFALWGLIMLLACSKSLIVPEYRSVFPHYFNAGVLWNEQNPLYQGGRGFIYFPTFAFLSSLISFMGLRFAEAFWEILQISILMTGLYVFVKTFKPSTIPSFFLLVTLFALPASFSSIRNGQANIIMLGIALWSAVAIADKAWSRAAVLLVLGLAVKPTFIVLFLLAFGLYRPLWIRLIVGMATAFFLPMLFASPDYVISQYMDAATMLRKTVDIGVNESNWASLMNVFPQLVGWYIPHGVQILIKGLMAVSTFLLCLKIRREHVAKILILSMFILSACYLLMFNPRTENNDYVLIGWFYGYLFGCAVEKKSRFIGIGMIVMIIITTFPANIARLFTHAHSWLTPLSVMVFTIGFVVFMYKDKNKFASFLIQKKPVGFPCKNNFDS